MKTFMNLNRFEAFSDGVFAIAMTLLVIEIKIPDLSQATASTAINVLIHTAPHILLHHELFGHWRSVAQSSCSVSFA
jgi:uncharacterized membrane protein